MALLDVGAGVRRSSRAGLEQAAAAEDQRNAANHALSDNEKAGTASAVATGTGIGTSILPGWGTAIGAAIGGLSTLF